MGDWTEKYRPKSLDDIVGNERAIIELRRWANSWRSGPPKKRAIILSGKPGTGKTSCAHALANDFNWTAIELNTSDARNAAKIKSVATFGAINETFTDSGAYMSHKDGGRKLIILDEADNLYERIKGSSSGLTDLSDRGGKKAIIDTIRFTNQPIILIVNDYYGLIKGSGDVLREMCQLIRFYDPYPSMVIALLKKICLKEGINVDLKVLQTIANRCKGDIRSAVVDLQTVCLDRKQVDSKSLNVLGYRDREKDIFSALREVFKTRNVKSIRDSLSHLDADPKQVILWINENLPKEYIDFNDLANGYDALSKSDIFLGRTGRTQNYSLWSYACDIMNGGVALAKTHTYPNDKYNFPNWLREKKQMRGNLEVRELTLYKLSSFTHISNKKCNYTVFNHFVNMFRNNTDFAVTMKQRLDLSETEIGYILGKSHKHKLNEILNPKEVITQEIEVEEKKEEIVEEKKENLQQSLFDF